MIVKKIVLILLALLVALSAVACGKSAKDPFEGKTIEESMDMILEGVETPDAMSMVLTQEDTPYFMFTQLPEGAEAVVSEGMINAIAHSVVLMRVAEGTDAAAIAAEVEANADPRKWICVEAEKKVVLQEGNTILLVMSNAACADAIAANYTALYEG